VTGVQTCALPIFPGLLTIIMKATVNPLKISSDINLPLPFAINEI
jgi:hypothetical protein